jgi:hypothetical protein
VEAVLPDERPSTSGGDTPAAASGTAEPPGAAWIIGLTTVLVVAVAGTAVFAIQRRLRARAVPVADPYAALTGSPRSWPDLSDDDRAADG